MFRHDNRDKEERQDDVLVLSQVLKQLEEEIQKLNYEKRYFLNVDTALSFFINKKIEAKKKENQELRLEVEKQRANCVKLAAVLNASIKASYSFPLYLAEKAQAFTNWFDFW